MGKWCGSSALWSALSRWKIDEINRKWSNGKHWILFARISNNNNNIVLLSFPLVRLRPVADLSRDGHAFIHSYSYQFWLPAKETGRYIQLWSYVYAINFMIGLATKWVRTPIDAPHNRWMGELILPEKWRILRMELHRCCCSSIIPRRKLLFFFYFSLGKNFAARNELRCFMLEVIALMLLWLRVLLLVLSLLLMVAVNVYCDLDGYHGRISVCSSWAMRKHTRTHSFVYCSVKVITKMSCYEVAIICFTWNLYAQNV